MFTSIKGKSVIVTGGSKGIGRGIADVFAAHDANITIAARGQQAAQAACDEINSSGGNACYAHCDVVEPTISGIGIRNW